MKVRIIVLSHVLVSVIPMAITLIKFDLHWGMIWGNEATVWSSLFALFS